MSLRGQSSPAQPDTLRLLRTSRDPVETRTLAKQRGVGYRAQLATLHYLEARGLVASMDEPPCGHRPRLLWRITGRGLI